MFIAIEGNIGAGKTTLAKLLSKKLNAVLVLEEFAENLFLPRFYKEPDRFAFPLELSFLADRYHQLRKHHTGQQTVVSDYYIYKSLIFARNNLSEDEMALFMRLYSIMFLQVKVPDRLVFLNSSVEMLQKRIAGRARSFEKHIKDSYLLDIHGQYMNYLRDQHDLVALVVDADQRDFVGDASDFNWLMKVIHEERDIGTYFLE